MLWPLYFFLPIHPSHSPFPFTLPLHPSPSPFPFTLPLHPSHSPFPFTLPLHPSHSPFPFTLPLRPPVGRGAAVGTLRCVQRAPAPRASVPPPAQQRHKGAHNRMGPARGVPMPPAVATAHRHTHARTHTRTHARTNVCLRPRAACIASSLFRRSGCLLLLRCACRVTEPFVFFAIKLWH